MRPWCSETKLFTATENVVDIIYVCLIYTCTSYYYTPALEISTKEYEDGGVKLL